MWAFIVKLVDADKLGGWVRAGVAAVFTIVLARWPVLGSIVGPDLQVAVAAAIATAVVGLWSQIAKNMAAG